MAKVQTPVNYLDAPEFQKFWDGRCGNGSRKSCKRVGKVEEKK